MKVIKFVLAIGGMVALLYALQYIAGIYLMFLILPYCLSAITGIGYSAMQSADHHLRDAWAWYWQQYKNLWQWGTGTPRKSLKSLIENSKKS